MGTRPLLATVLAAIAALGAVAALSLNRAAPADAARGAFTNLTASVPPCTGTDLAVTAGPSQAGATHVGLAVEFRNRSAAPCHLRGYPRVVALNTAGHAVAVARQTLSGYLGGVMNGTRALPLVVIRPGRTASAFVEGSDYNYNSPKDAGCPPHAAGYATLVVTPPGTGQAFRLRILGISQGLCSGLEVHPVVPGTSGQLLANH